MSDMQDQYDDGRYDGDMNPGYEHGSYAPSRKESPMSMQQRLNAELKAINDLRDELNSRAAKVRKELKSVRVPEPDASSDAFAIDVKFSTRGKQYRFLLIRTKGGWFTTGQKQENSYFTDWEALVNWLEGPDVAWHSAMISLQMHEVVAWSPAP